MAIVNKCNPYTAHSRKSYYKYRAWLDEVFYYEVCAYCLTHQLHAQIDHYLPKNSYPDLIKNPNNLLLACSHCNQKKSDYDSEKEEFAIFNCLREDLSHYFIISYDHTESIKGQIRIKDGISNEEKQRAIKNIETLGLNHKGKMMMRGTLLECLESLIEREDTQQDNFEHKIFQPVLSYIARNYLCFLVFNIEIPENIKTKILSIRKEKLEKLKKR